MLSSSLEAAASSSLWAPYIAFEKKEVPIIIKKGSTVSTYMSSSTNHFCCCELFSATNFGPQDMEVEHLTSLAGYGPVRQDWKILFRLIVVREKYSSDRTWTVISWVAEQASWLALSQPNTPYIIQVWWKKKLAYIIRSRLGFFLREKSYTSCCAFQV